MIRIFAHRYVRGAALALLAGLAAPLAAQGAPAPEAAAGADHPAYGEVFDAMAAAVDNEKVLDNGLATMRQQLAATPVLAQAEARSPGLIEEIVVGIRPIVRRHSERVAAQYRPQMAAALAEHLTPEEAVRVAAFYRSDLGRKLMGTVTDNYNLDQTLTNAMAQKELTEEDVSADIAAAVGAGIKNMDPKDILEMARQFMSDPAMAKLQRANPAILAIRARMENEPLTKADETEMGNVIAAVFARRSGK